MNSKSSHSVALLYHMKATIIKVRGNCERRRQENLESEGIVRYLGMVEDYGVY